MDPFRAFNAAMMAASVVASIAEVASSKISTRAPETRARASAIRCRCPPDNVRPRSPATVS